MTVTDERHDFTLPFSGLAIESTNMLQSRALANGFKAEAEPHEHGILFRVRKGRDSGTCVIDDSGAVTRTSGVYRPTIAQFFSVPVIEP